MYNIVEYIPTWWEEFLRSQYGPLSCLPEKLATHSINNNIHGNHNTSVFDRPGCLKSLNNGAKAFNHQLRSLCKLFRSHMRNAMIVFVDIYAIKYHLIANSADYGNLSYIHANIKYLLCD